MNNVFKVIGIIAVMGIVLACAYLSGTAQTEPVMEIRKTEKTPGAVRDKYADTGSEGTIMYYI